MSERKCSLLHSPWMKKLGASLQGYPKYMFLTAVYSWYSAVETWWHTVTHGRGSEGETGKWSG